MPPINTKHVSGRRTLNYKTLDEFLADAEQMARTPHKLLGNWSYGQILRHISIGMNGSIDGLDFKPPLFVRVIMRVMKNYWLERPMPAGFQLPKGPDKIFIPGPTTVEEGLELVRKAAERLKTTATRAPHPVFGKLDRAGSDQFQLKHAALHMSFVVPT